VGEYDAFGRKVGEDPIAESGWRSEVSPPEPVGAPEPAVSEPPVVQADQGPVPDIAFSPQQVARGLARVVRLFVFIVILGAIAGALTTLGGNGTSGIGSDRPAVSIPSLPPEDLTGPTTPAVADKPPAGLQPGSLLRRSEFSRAMTRLRARGFGRLTNLRVAADRINVQLVTPGGRLRNVQVDPGGKVREISISGPGFGFVGALAYDQIDRAAPERLTREAARRRETSPTRVDYLVMFELGDDVVWSLFFKNGAHFQADAAGHLQRRP
jgi:hypothetical protein